VVCGEERTDLTNLLVYELKEKVVETTTTQREIDFGKDYDEFSEIKYIVEKEGGKTTKFDKLSIARSLRKQYKEKGIKSVILRHTVKVLTISNLEHIEGNL